jgi:hypothetical protein
MTSVRHWGFILALTALILACAGDDGTHIIRWENPTRTHVLIYIGEGLQDFAVDLQPCGSKEQPIGADRWEGIVAVRSSQGDELYRSDLSWDELKGQDFTFQVRSESFPTPYPFDASRPPTDKCPDPLPFFGRVGPLE